MQKRLLINNKYLLSPLIFKRHAGLNTDYIEVIILKYGLKNTLIVLSKNYEGRDKT